MDHIIQDINELCSKDIHLCFADNKVRLSRAFYHVLVMDGAEVAAALLCDVNQCPVCTTVSWIKQMWLTLTVTPNP
jgi:hypothetical protein